MEGFKSCGVAMSAHGPLNIGDRAAGWGDACAGEAVRDVLEDIEICSVNVELLNRTGSFDDPAWIERRSLAARTRLAAETDPVLLPGCRKIVRKWNAPA